MPKKPNRLPKVQSTKSLAPRFSENLKVTRLSPASFRLEWKNKSNNVSTPSKTPDMDIAGLLGHFNEGQKEMVRDWRQKIEKVEARETNRPPKTIDTAQASQDLSHAIMTETKYSESAKSLLSRLLPSRKPSITAKWEQDSELHDHSQDSQDERWLQSWWKADGSILTPKQKGILKELHDARQRLRTCDPTNAHVARALQRDYEVVICHAIRNGLEDHPWCLGWVMQQQMFSNRKSLHRLYRTHPNLEKGLLRPIAGNEKRLLKQIVNLRLANPKLSLRSVHKLLHSRNLYKSPWSTFQKWTSDPYRRAIIEPDI